jgi:hypothetical protein
MGHVQIRRLALGLSGMLALAALGFGWLVSRDTGSPAPADSTAQAAFARRCAGCHELAELRAGIRRSGDSTADASALAALLAEHGDASVEEQARLVTLLLGGEAG